MKNIQVTLPFLLDMAIIYIPILPGVEYHSSFNTRMPFSLGGLQALGLIETDLPRTADGNFSAPKAKLTGQALYLMTSMMGDTDMDLTDGVDTVKELWSWLSYSHYHVKGWGAKSILFQKLVRLRHSDCEGIGTYVRKLPGLTQRLTGKMGRVCGNLWPVYLLSNRLRDKHPTGAAAFRILAWLYLGQPSKKRRSNSIFPGQSSLPRAKSTSSKATAKCAHWEKSFH